MRGLIFLLTLSSSISVASECQPSSPSFLLEKHYCEGRELVKAARVVFKTQPYLYSSSEFRELQELTRFYQNHRRHVSLTMQAIGNPGMGDFPTLSREYLRLESLAVKLIGELPSHLNVHHSMNAKGEARERWLKKLRSTLYSMLVFDEGLNPDPSFYEMHDCDYVSQPLNILWFSLNSLHILNHIGEIKHGERWASAVEGKTEILSFDPMSLLNSIASPAR